MTINNGLEFNERLFTQGISTANFNELQQQTLVSGVNYQRNWNQKLTTEIHYGNSTYKANSQTTASQRVCLAQRWKRKFSKMPHARLTENRTMTWTDKYELTYLSPLWTEKQKE